MHLPNDEAHYVHDVNRQQGFYTNQNIGVTGYSNTLNIGQQHVVGASGVNGLTGVTGATGVTGVNTVHVTNQHLVSGTSTVNAVGYQPLGNASNSFNVAGYQALPSRGLSRSNFVTSDGYVPSYYSPLPPQIHQ